MPADSGAQAAAAALHGAWRLVRPARGSQAKKSPLQERAESIFLEENRGDRCILLHRKIFRQFFFVMSDIIKLHSGIPANFSYRLMAQITRHRNVNIVQLAAGEAVAAHCSAGDIAVEEGGDGWYLHFVAANGSLDSYETPYRSALEALWAAKAAAEFGF
jgi:hypothetical protein